MKIVMGLWLLLCVASNCRADKALKSARGESAPVLALQGLSYGQFKEMVVSPEARWIVTQRGGETMTLWDGRVGLRWGEIKDSRYRAPLFFSPTGDLLFCISTVTGDGKHPVWRPLEVRRIPSGELVRRYNLDGPFWSNGNAVRGFHDGAVETWNVAGKQLARRTIANLPSNERLNFSSDGSLLVAGAGEVGGGEARSYIDGIARLWRVSDGVKIAEIKDHLRIISPIAAVSADGRFIATEGDDPDWRQLDDSMGEAAFARNFRINLWDARTGKLLHDYQGYYSLSYGVRLLQFSPDGKFLFSAGFDGNLRRLETATGRLTQISLVDKDDSSLLDWPLGLAPDMRVGAGRGSDYELLIFDALSNRLRKRFATPLSAPNLTSWSPDGHYLYGDRLLFDARSGATVASAFYSGDYYSQVRGLIWRDGELWTTSLQDVTRWKLPSLEKISEWRISATDNQSGSDTKSTKDYTDGVRISPDGSTVLTGDPRGALLGGKGLWVWDAMTHQKRRIIIEDFKADSDSLGYLSFFPQGDKILRPTQGSMELWDLATGEKLREWHDPIDPSYQASALNVALKPVAISPDGKLIAARASRDETVWIFHATNDAPPLRLPVKFGYDAQFLRDNRTLLLFNKEKLQAWDACGDGRAPIRSWQAPSGYCRLSPDESLAIILVSSPSSCLIWNLKRDVEVARFYTTSRTLDIPPDGWLALTPQGFYNASPQGEKHLRWRDGNGFWPLEKSRARFFAPNRVREALQPDLQN